MENLFDNDLFIECCREALSYIYPNDRKYYLEEASNEEVLCFTTTNKTIAENTNFKYNETMTFISEEVMTTLYEDQKEEDKRLNKQNIINFFRRANSLRDQSEKDRQNYIKYEREYRKLQGKPKDSLEYQKNLEIAKLKAKSYKEQMKYNDLRSKWWAYRGRSLQFPMLKNYYEKKMSSLDNDIYKAIDNSERHKALIDYHEKELLSMHSKIIDPEQPSKYSDVEKRDYSGLLGRFRLLKDSLKDELINKLTSPTAKKLGLALGATVVLSALLYISYKVYKEKFSDAAKACSRLKGESKKNCMIDYKIKALQLQISKLKETMDACDTTNDPVKCKKVLTDKINKLSKKIIQLERPYMF